MNSNESLSLVILILLVFCSQLQLNAKVILPLIFCDKFSLFDTNKLIMFFAVVVV